MTRQTIWVQLCVSLYIVCSVAKGQLVKVAGRAQAYVGDSGLKNAKLIWLEKNQTVMCDEDGFYSISTQVGSNITLLLENYPGFHTTQTNTFTVPPGGASGYENGLFLQVPQDWVYELFKLVLPEEPKPNACHLVVTVCDKGKTLKSDPQGIEGAVVTLKPNPTGAKPFYFGYLWGITDPFERGLNSTSLDGGILYFNVPIGQEYVISASKLGVTFADPPFSVMRCATPGFINAAPPQGPRVG